MPAQRDRRSRNPNDANGNEGGRFAIAGFFYQVVGVAELLAEPEPQFGRDEMRGILSVTHEKYGQDAVLEGTESPGMPYWELVQFKFSLAGARPIQPKELYEEVVDGFANSERVASKAKPLSCRFRLVTNRPLSLKAEREVAAAKSGESTQYLDGHDDRRRILAGMKREQKTLGELKRSIEEYGRRRGMFPAELNDGVQKLVGWLMENTAALGSLRVTRENLDKRLTGSDKVREITCDALRDTMLEDLRQFRTRAGLPDRLVRRAVADEIQRAVQEFPIVVLVGQGGTGKSALLESVLGEFLESGPRRDTQVPNSPIASPVRGSITSCSDGGTYLTFQTEVQERH